MAHARPRVALLTALPVLLVGLAGATASAQSSAQQREVQDGVAEPAPKFEIESQVLDFGRILDTEEVTRAIVFRNAGDAPLEIVNVRTTCGCTAAEPPDGPLAPGESFELEIGFNPIGKRPGQQEQSVTLRTNDRENSVVVVKVRANIQALVAVEPASVNMGSVAKKARKDAMISITGMTSDFEAHTITIVGEGSKYFETEILDPMQIENEDGTISQRTDIIVSLKADAPPGRAQAMAVIRTNEQRRRIVNVGLTAEVKGDVVISPTRMQLGVLRAGEGVTETIEITNAKGQPFRVVGVEMHPLDPAGLNPFPIEYEIVPANPDPAATEADKAKPSDAYRLTLQVPAQEAGGRVRGSIVIRTDVALEEEIKMPYVGRVRAATGQ
ncbi:MAG: DUF1573 domain-containing protein [Planctomycetota bacterium]